MDKETSKWLGFLRIDLLNPQIDGLTLLSGDKIFMLQLKQEYVIGKVEKAFEFKSTSANRKLKIQSPILTKYNFCQLFWKLIWLEYTSE
jgi:hypothetical protein